MARNTKKEADSLLKILNNALKLEYGIIIHMPKFVEKLDDDDTTAQLALQLGTDSVKHADKIAAMITDLGGNPEW